MNNDVIAGDFSTKDSITEWILECHVNADFDKLTLRMPSKIVTYEKARPQGEWGKNGECPFCSYIRQWKDDKFCGNCGADMRKGLDPI